MGSDPDFLKTRIGTPLFGPSSTILVCIVKKTENEDFVLKIAYFRF